MTDRIAAMRRIVIRLVVGVVLVNAAALLLRRFTGLGSGTALQRQLFTAAWLVAALLVVLPSLRALRVARRS
ncbi:MAG TPA: hypothetical protein VFN22_10220 [Gemmatimonadales bacterium]|nr:hypothetical protein [Gemmatimonadales bacterium]